MLLGNAKHRGQPKSSAFAHGFRGEEWLKDMLDGRSVHATTRIPDGETDERSRTDGWIGFVSALIDLGTLDRDGQPATARHHRVTRVYTKVGDNLFNHPAIAFDPHGRFPMLE